MRFVLKKYDKVLFVFFAAALISSFLFWAFEEQFDQKTWRANPSMRYKMADDLIESELLLGKSKDDVMELLGIYYDSIPNAKDNMVYKLGTPPSFFSSKVSVLVVFFSDSQVVEVIEITK